MVSLVESRDLLHENQFGFRSGRSCEQAGATLVIHTVEASDNNLYKVAIFCDISKALD